MMQQTVEMPFLRTCKTECAHPIKSEIIGNIPSWLKGTLLFNGPGMKQIGKENFKHMYDGFALIQKFLISDGEVYYENRFLRSDAYERSIRANHLVLDEFGTPARSDPYQPIWRRLLSFALPEMTDNCSVTIYTVGDQVFTATETNFIRCIDPVTLETGAKVDLSKFVSVHMANCHPQSDDKNIYLVGSKFGPNGSYKLIKIPKTKNPFEKSSSICSIPMKRPLSPSYYHTFAMTENYLIFIEQPLVVSALTMISRKITGKAIIDGLSFDSNQKTQFYIIEKTSGIVLSTKYMSEPFVYLHTINAFEDKNQIVLDIICYPNDSIIMTTLIKNLRKVIDEKQDYHAYSEIRRYVLPIIGKIQLVRADSNLAHSHQTIPSTKGSPLFYSNGSSVELKYENLSISGPSMCEFPQINQRFNGKNYRYFYAVEATKEMSTKLIKFDTKNNDYKVWEELNSFLSEPVFIERPSSNANDEDDGVILSQVVSHLDEKQVFLLILDAKTFSELARAKFYTQSSIPASFHSLFIDHKTSYKLK